ncbi:hypothetical protein E2320_018062 [Naja naja]|nr:hypothetical protein E2320_018062 [Naja naja]
MVANDTEKNTELVINMYDMILMKGAEMDPASKLEEIILKHILHREMKDPKFQHLSRKFTEWTYGPIHISLYDLTSVDSCEENSVLEILAYSSNTPVSAGTRHSGLVRDVLCKHGKIRAAHGVRLAFGLGEHALLHPRSPGDGNLHRDDPEALIILTGGAPHSAHNTSVPLSDDSKDQAVYSGLFQTALLLFRFTIGMGDLEYNENVKYSDLAMLLVLLFVILTYILLLNMLIALMSETVTNVSGGTSHSVHNPPVPLSNHSEDQAMCSRVLQTALLLFRFTNDMSDLELNKKVQLDFSVILLVLLFVILTYILLLNVMISPVSETVTDDSNIPAIHGAK